MSGGGFVELCPQCKKYLTVGDFWNGGSQLFCVACGYFYTVRIDFGEEALQESGFLPDYDGTRDGGCQPRKITTEERRGFGAALFTDRQECKARICYPVPITQELIDEFMKDISSPDIDLTRCYLTRWNDETQDVEFIFGREELVADLLVENNRWDDEIGDWIGQEEPFPSLYDELLENMGEESRTENGQEA